MRAYILAGGLGSRLREVVADLPKPLASIAGRPFLEYQLRYLRSQGIDRVVMCVGYRYQAVIDHFGDRFDGIEIEYSIEKTPLGTGGALCQALKQFPLDEDALCVNGDSLFAADVAAMRRFHREQKASMTLSVLYLEDNTRYGSVNMDGQQRVTGFVEKSGQGGAGFINTGVYLLAPEFARMCRQHDEGTVSLEREIFPMLAQGGSCYAFAQQQPFIDIGIPLDYQRAQQLIPEIIQQIEAESLCHKIS